MERPLSPFMFPIWYRFQITSALSILHRLTGIGLAVGSVLLAWWLISVAAGGELFQATHRFLVSPIGLALRVFPIGGRDDKICCSIRHDCAARRDDATSCPAARQRWRWPQRVAAAALDRNRTDSAQSLLRCLSAMACHVRPHHRGRMARLPGV